MSSGWHHTIGGKSRYWNHSTVRSLSFRSNAWLPPSFFRSNDSGLHSRNAQCRLHTPSECSSSNRLVTPSPTHPTNTKCIYAYHTRVNTGATHTHPTYVYMVNGTHGHIYLIQSFADQVEDQVGFTQGSRTGRPGRKSVSWKEIRILY